MLAAFPRISTLVDVEARLRLVDEFGEMQQVLSLANPPLELIAPPQVTQKLARIANAPRGMDATRMVAAGSETLHAAGVALAGPIAPEIQFVQTFAAAVVAGSRATSRGPSG